MKSNRSKLLNYTKIAIITWTGSKSETQKSSVKIKLDLCNQHLNSHINPWKVKRWGAKQCHLQYFARCSAKLWGMLWLVSLFVILILDYTKAQEEKPIERGPGGECFLSVIICCNRVGWETCCGYSGSVWMTRVGKWSNKFYSRVLSCIVHSS